MSDPDTAYIVGTPICLSVKYYPSLSRFLADHQFYAVCSVSNDASLQRSDDLRKVRVIWMGRSRTPSLKSE